VRPALALLADKLATCTWDKASVAASIKEVLAATGIKMPQLAMAARVLLLGTSQTPSLDAVIAMFVREVAIERLRTA
jgi:glutamyl-tRNA synthetase